MGQNCLAESQSRLYPHMRAKFGRDPTAVSKKVPFNFISRLMEADIFSNIFSNVVVKDGHIMSVIISVIDTTFGVMYF